MAEGAEDASLELWYQTWPNFVMHSCPNSIYNLFSTS